LDSTEKKPLTDATDPIARARSTYNIERWGAGYFDVNAAGHVVARPGSDGAIDLYRLATELPRHNLALPVLVRFSGILEHRLDELCAAFDRARAAADYAGRYTAVYPIKVNQQASVVDALVRHGGERLGLEAGSKPELLAVIARARPGSIVVCNGYKDREYLRLALIGRALGLRVHVVVEKLSELDMLLAESAALGVAPLIGLRARLASIGAGKWQNTGGEKSKFGLTASEVLRVVERLRAAGRLDCLAMLHFHMGSQIANIRDVQTAMREAARYYAELRALGAPVAVVNVGGGLGVDYEGTRSRSDCSMNYSVAEYANNIVHALKNVCDDAALPHPEIVSESGRALTAHHAVLITNVIDVEPAPGAQTPRAAGTDEAPLLRDLWQGLKDIDRAPPLETLHDAQYRYAEAQSQFGTGAFGLAERARAEELYFATSQAVRARLKPETRAHRETLDELNEKLADKYFCNFSLFQSMPDHWAIEQIFPCMPLHRLNEPPARRGILQDITCDSDGRVDRYVDGEGIETSLPLHAPRAGEPYLLGIFLVGAYQEILGDMHNLFGDTDSVQVENQPGGGYRLVEARRGDTVDSVLRYVNFRAEDLLDAYRAKIAGARDLSPTQREAWLTELKAGLSGYTYLED
jgi:arginine decarboxylase